MIGFWSLIRRDLLLARSQGGASLLAVAFFVLAVTLFPFAVGPEPQVLARIGGGVIWVAALLATLLSLDRMFQSDFDDGSLDLLALSPLDLEFMVLAKTVAHWLAASLPLIVIAPLLALLMNLPPAVFLDLILTMLVGTPALSLIGAVGAALTVGVRRGGVLLPLIVLPLYIPTLIFGVAALEAAIAGPGAGGGMQAPMMLLGAISLFALVLSPLAGAAGIRLALS